MTDLYLCKSTAPDFFIGNYYWAEWVILVRMKVQSEVNLRQLLKHLSQEVVGTFHVICGVFYSFFGSPEFAYYVFQTFNYLEN